MINVRFPKPFTLQPLCHMLPSPLNFDYMSPFAFFLFEKHFLSLKKKKKNPLIVKFPKILLFSNFVSMLTIF